MYAIYALHSMVITYYASLASFNSEFNFESEKSEQNKYNTDNTKLNRELELAQNRIVSIYKSMLLFTRTVSTSCNIQTKNSLEKNVDAPPGTDDSHSNLYVSKILQTFKFMINFTISVNCVHWL